MKYAAAYITSYLNKAGDNAQLNVIRKTEFFSHAKAKKLADAFDKESPQTRTKFDDGSTQFIGWRTLSEKEWTEVIQGTGRHAI